MSAANVLLKPEECAMLLVDFQAGLGFGVESIPRQLVVNNAVGLARTAVAFKVPVIAWFPGPFAVLQIKKATPKHGTPFFTTSTALMVAATLDTKLERRSPSRRI